MALLALAASLLAGCGEEEPTIVTAVETTATGTVPTYKRQPVPFYRGIDEPRAGAWQDLVFDQERLLRDGFNTVILSPPVLISQRAGGKPRIILEGEAGSVPGLTDALHQAGMAVFISPTTTATGLKPEIEVSDANLSHLTEDARRWAGIAEEKQAELFSPLAEFNLALGTDTANQWSALTLPLVRDKFKGKVVARVVPQIGEPTATAPEQYDFEKLSYRGYDLLMLDIYPREKAFDLARFEAEVDDVLNRASIIAARDGLRGVLVEFGSWREEGGGEVMDGPALGPEGQAQVTGSSMQLAQSRVGGMFWRGWTLPGRGAKGYDVEEVLRRGFGGT